MALRKNKRAVKYLTIKEHGVEIEIKRPPFHFKNGFTGNGRIIMEIRLGDGSPIKGVAILNSCAPHIGYPTEAIGKYRGYVETYISLIPNNLVKVWRADNDGQ